MKSKVAEDVRQRMKLLSLGINYGMAEKSLATTFSGSEALRIAAEKLLASLVENRRVTESRNPKEC